MLRHRKGKTQAEGSPGTQGQTGGGSCAGDATAGSCPADHAATGGAGRLGATDQPGSTNGNGVGANPDRHAASSADDSEDAHRVSLSTQTHAFRTGTDDGRIEINCCA